MWTGGAMGGIANRGRWPLCALSYKLLKGIQLLTHVATGNILLLLNVCVPNVNDSRSKQDK